MIGQVRCGGFSGHYRSSLRDENGMTDSIGWRMVPSNGRLIERHRSRSERVRIFLLNPEDVLH